MATENLTQKLTPIGPDGPTMAAAQQHASQSNPDTAQLVDIPLNDIMPIIEVTDHSLYFLIGTVFVSIMIVSLLGYLGYRFLKNRRKNNLRKEKFTLLQSVDFSNSKEAAYTITEIGYFFSEDSQRVKEKFEHLLTLLAPYKYKAVVADIDEDVKANYRNFVEMIEV